MHNKDFQEFEPFEKLPSSLPIAIPSSLGRGAGVFGRSVNAEESPPGSNRSVYSDEEVGSEFGSALLKEMDFNGLNTEIREELKQQNESRIHDYIECFDKYFEIRAIEKRIEEQQRPLDS